LNYEIYERGAVEGEKPTDVLLPLSVSAYIEKYFVRGDIHLSIR
jgi:hypothetical protein